MSQLLISKNAWHYRYWFFIRALWGFGKLPDKTSLCPYCQTMLWLSILTFVFSPLMIAGWLLGKAMRYTYRVLEAAKVHKVVDVLDKLKIGDGLDRMADNMSRCPAVTALMTLLSVIIALALVVFVLLMLGIAIGAIPFMIMAIPEFLWMCLCALGVGLLYAGYGIMIGFGTVGCFLTIAVTKTVQGLIWFFTNSVVWWWVETVVASTLITAVVSTVAVYLFYRFWSSSFGKGASKWMSYKFNGYKEAHESAVERRVEKQRVVQKKIEAGELPSPGKPLWSYLVKWLMLSLNGIFLCIEWVYYGVKDFFVSKKVDWEGNAAKVMSPFSMFWTFVVAFKKGICPLVEFVNLEEKKEEVAKA